MISPETTRFVMVVLFKVDIMEIRDNYYKLGNLVPLDHVGA